MVLALFTLVTISILWLSQQPDMIEMTLFGYQLMIPVYTFMGLCLAFGVLCYGLVKLSFQWRLMRLKRRYNRQISQEVEGANLIVNGLSALCAKDIQQAKKIQSKLPAFQVASPLGLLFTAQMALLEQDEAQADLTFQTMLALPQTRLIGLRGLATQHAARGEFHLAQSMISKILRRNPKSLWALEASFDLSIKMKAWSKAHETLRQLKKNIALGQTSCQEALILFELAQLERGENPHRSKQLLAKSFHLDPAVPAISTSYAALLRGEKSYRKASKILEESWQKNQHPDVASAYIATENDVMKKFQLMQRLLALTPDSWQGQLLLAESAVNAQLWGVARSILEELVKKHPTHKVLQICTRLEEGFSAPHDMKSLFVSTHESIHPDPVWVCKNCGYHPHRWESTCASCLSFGSYEWTQAPFKGRLLSSFHDMMILPKSSTQ